MSEIETQEELPPIEYRPDAPVRLSSSEDREVAAGIAAAMMQDAESAGLVTQPDVAVPASPAPSRPTQTQPEPPAEIAAEPEPFDFSQYEPQLSPDLEELLEDDTPDFAAQAREELAVQAQFTEDTGEYGEYEEPDAEKLALKKENEFLKGRIVETNRGKWLRENLNAYPLAATYAKSRIEGIQATSRRGFAREAAKINAEVTAIAKPLLDDLKARLAAQGQIVTVQHRQIVQDAWGVPMVEPAAGGMAASHQQRMAAAMKRGDLKEVIKATIESGGV